MSGEGGGGGGGGGAGQISGLTGILNWSLAQTGDGTSAPTRVLTEEDKKFFFDAMAANTVNPVARMRSISADLAAAGADGPLSADALAQLLRLLEELQDHVEDIDCACDLSKVGGLPPLLALLRCAHAPLRAAAAEVLATAVQNNPKAQQQVLDGGALEPLLALARGDEDATARLKGLLALGSLIRHFPAAEAAFRLGDGFGLLKAAVCSGEPRLQRKAFQLARHLLTQDSNLVAMVQLGFIRAAAAALLSADGVLREAALGWLLDCARAVDFESLPVAVDEFRHPALAERLAALRAALAAAPPGSDAAERGAEEAALADALHRMLAAPAGA